MRPKRPWRPHDGRRLEPKVRLWVLSDLRNETSKGQLPDQELRRLLVSTDLSQSDGGAEPVPQPSSCHQLPDQELRRLLASTDLSQGDGGAEPVPQSSSRHQLPEYTVRKQLTRKPQNKTCTDSCLRTVEVGCFLGALLGALSVVYLREVCLVRPIVGVVVRLVVWWCGVSGWFR